MAEDDEPKQTENSLEKKLLLQQCFSRRKLYEIGLKRAIPYFRSLNNPWETDEDRAAFEIALRVTADELEEIFREFKPFEWIQFDGSHYTMRGGKLSFTDSWEPLEMKLKESRLQYGVDFTRLLTVLLTLRKGMGPMDIFHGMRQLGFKGREEVLIEILENLSKTGIVRVTYEGIDYKEWGLPEEILPLLREFMEGTSRRTAPYSTKQPPIGVKPPFKQPPPDILEAESQALKSMDEEFTAYLTILLEERLKETLEFGKAMNVNTLSNHLRELFGPILYFDSLLALAQQYGLADVEIVSPAGKTGLKSGFNLALFGEPGTGKSFATRDLILGGSRASIPPYGLPGRNRYAGGITPARFIRIGQAYEGRAFNFIVPEFNDWFKYKGMVEPLKLAMERGEIRYETHRESIGPYRFTSFFTVNYNTAVLDKGYRTTISDPNFEAIEDRMLCRLHRLTKERYVEIARSQMKLALSRMHMKGTAQKIRDHLTLIHAIEAKHAKVKHRFAFKPVLVTRETYQEIETARNAILNRLRSERVPFSARLEDRALRLAASLSLMGYFQTENENLSISKDVLKLALRFYVEEASARSGETFDANEVLEEFK